MVNFLRKEIFMKKERKLDFVLKERNGYRLIFRFYPKQSHCHSFNDKPPTSWNEVYKVYYSYAILGTSNKNPRYFHAEMNCS